MEGSDVGLRAGPVSAVLRDGALRYFRFGGHEVLRRIYVAVRDADWGTVPGEISGLRMEAGSGHFLVTFTSTHSAGPIDFRWQARIEGSPDGRVEFNMDGEAMSEFDANRIGFCVLHPIEGFAGVECEIEDPLGRRRTGVVPREVSPRQPFQNMRAISWPVPGGWRAEVRMEGETFEMEDHRNWTDGGFKTYGTPLELPYPVRVRPGTAVRQRVVFTVREDVARIAMGHVERPMPEIGIAGDPRGLGIPYVRVDAAGSAPALPLEVGLELGGEPRRELAEAAARALELGWTVRRWILTERDSVVCRSSTARIARELLADAAIVCGTRGHFAELNRNRPEAGVFDGVCFQVDPQVHSCDDGTLAENCEAQRDAVATARGFTGGAAVHVGPVRLKPGGDRREREPFYAAWVLASFRYLAEAGAASVTYGLPEGGGEYPVERLLASLCEFQEGTVTPCVSSRPLEAACVALRAGERGRLLAANLTAGRLAVELPLPGRPLRYLEAHEVAVIDFEFPAGSEEQANDA